MNKIPHILIEDDSGHTYVIPESERDNFEKWVEAAESGKFAAMKKFDYFNKCRVDLPRLKIYEWRDE